MSSKPWADYAYYDFVRRAADHFGFAFGEDDEPYWPSIQDAHRGILDLLARQGDANDANAVWAYLVNDLQRNYGVPPSAIRKDLGIFDAMDWPVPQVRQQMQGEWKVTDCTVGGTQVLEMLGQLLTVSGARFRQDSPERVEEGSFTLQKSGSDVEINFFGGDPFPRATGRISIEGDLMSLTIRPTGDEAHAALVPAGSRLRVIRYSRRTPIRLSESSDNTPPALER